MNQASIFVAEQEGTNWTAHYTFLNNGVQPWIQVKQGYCVLNMQVSPPASNDYTPALSALGAHSIQ